MSFDYLSGVGASIDPNNPSTFIEPLEVKDEREALACRYTAYYLLPLTPNSVSMALKQLPSHIPKGTAAVLRLHELAARRKIDGASKTRFAIEVVYPHADRV